MLTVSGLRILFDKNVPVGVRRFLSEHEVTTFADMGWHPQLTNGELLTAAEQAAFEVFLTSDQNIRYQQNLMGRKLGVLVLGSNVWPIVREHEREIAATVLSLDEGSVLFLEMLPPRRRQK